MKGWLTPTEAGSVGTFAVILHSVAQRGINLRGFIMPDVPISHRFALHGDPGL